MHRGIRAKLVRGSVALFAVALIVAVLLVVDPEPAPVMLGITLGSSLSRSQLGRHGRERLEALALLPLLGLATIGLGTLLHVQFVLGAAVYVLVLVGTVLLRQTGDLGKRFSGLAATPFLAVLFLPGGAGRDHGPVLAVAEPLLIAVFAWVVVTAVQLVVQRIGVLPSPVVRPASPVRAASPATAAAQASSRPTGGLRPSATTRSALQLGVGLTLAFVIGVAGFGTHWAWVVLSAVIVAYLPRGRADAVSKGLHRLLGAAAGSVFALVPLAAGPGDSTVLVVAALAAIGVGILFREVSYAVWAFGVTVALTLLDHLTGQASPLIGMRLVEIAIGVTVGLLPVCLLLPVRTTDVVRSRLRPVLSAVAERLEAAGPSERAATQHRIEADLRELDQASASLREAARVLAIVRRPPPEGAQWVRDTHTIAAAAIASPPSVDSDFRRAVRDARRALRDPAALGTALSVASRTAN
ncbi:Fusaric acid resistance protein-like [Agreia bicolorata]|uniref:Fusaric acid resistance protein-like n=1 Tax=Agreia bicolorata TaxID=110935 RepID=A0A1T4Y3G6_9MICO|nr:FUSC family protein [Agreia bicolorata]SKA96290.1 Fusaric acid resistance protein-like [Agreia bicolorata]